MSSEAIKPQLYPIPLDLRRALSDPVVPLGISDRLFEAMKTQTGLYKKVQVLPNDPEWRFVWRYFYHDVPRLYSIKRMYCLHERHQQQAFEVTLSSLEREAETFKPTWNQEPLAAQRAQAIERWRSATALFSPFQSIESDGRRRNWSKTKLLPLWHGSSAPVCDSIATSGFVYFGKTSLSGPSSSSSSTDDGFFGSGIYFTNSARYAADIYSSGHLLLAWVSMREPFPVVGDPDYTDMKVLKGKGAYKDYNAHYVPVVSINPVDPYEAMYFPAQAGDVPHCDEVVVFHKSQTVPRFWVELEITIPYLMDPSHIPHFVNELIPHLMHLLEHPEVDQDPKLRRYLGEELTFLLKLKEDDDLEDYGTKYPELYEQLTQLIDTGGKVNRAVRGLLIGSLGVAPGASSPPSVSTSSSSSSSSFSSSSSSSAPPVVDGSVAHGSFTSPSAFSSASSSLPLDVSTPDFLAPLPLSSSSSRSSSASSPPLSLSLGMCSVEELTHLLRTDSLVIMDLTDALNRSALRDRPSVWEIARMIRTDERAKRRLFEVIEQSRGQPALGIAAANALTFLAAAHISFSGLDFSGVQAPGAHLYGALCHRTNWRGANLQGAHLGKAYLVEADLRGAHLRGICFGEYPVLTGHSEKVTSVAFSPDGKRVVSGSDDRTLRLWDVATGRLIGELWEGHSSGVTSVAFSPDGTRVVSGSSDKTLRLWDVATGESIGKSWRGHTSDVNSVAFSPDGTRVVSGSRDRIPSLFLDDTRGSLEYTLRLWDVATGEPIGKPWQGHTYHITSVAFSPDGTRVVSGSWDNTLRLWDIATGKPIGRLFRKSWQGHSDTVTSVAFSSDGTRVVSGSRDKTLRLWDVATGEPIGAPWQGHSNSVMSVAVSPDGTRVVSGSWDHTLRLWDAVTGEPVGAPWKGHTNGVRSVAFSPDGKRVVSGSEDTTLRLWDVEVPLCLPSKGHSNNVKSVAFSPDGKRVVSGSWDDTLRLWDVATGEPIGPLWQNARGTVTSVAFSPDGKRVLSGSSDWSLSLWDVGTGKTIGKDWWGHTNYVNSLAFSPDGKRVVSGSLDNTLRLWDAATGKPIGAPWQGHSNSVMSVAVSPDGTRVVSGSWDHTLRLWDAVTGEPIGAPWQGPKGVRSVTFSPDGKRALSGSDDHTLCLWDAATGEPIGASWEGHSREVISLAFSLDGKRVVSGSWDNTLRLWDAVTGEPIGAPWQGPKGVQSVAFSPDGSKVISSGEDGSIMCWTRCDEDVYVITWIGSKDPLPLQATGALLQDADLDPRARQLLVERGGVDE